MEWTETHDYLELVMKRELETMRLLLENMNLEEQFLMKKQKKHWAAMLQERELLMKQLDAIRQDKGLTTQKLQRLLQMSEASLKELLPPDHGASFEILSLQDQMTTLTDRISLQTSRNEMLKSLVQARVQVEPKKKIAIATLPMEEYKERSEH